MLFRFVVAALFVGLAALAYPADPTPPGQPASGPGGSDYPHAGWVVNSYGQGVDRYWIYEPDQPKPDSAPIVAIIHGWGGMVPRSYLGWIRHMTQKGNIVIYPQYQELWTPQEQFTPNAVNSIKNAIKRLQLEPGHVLPEIDKFAVMGHSAGGATTLNIGIVADSAGLPIPRALVPVESGAGTWIRPDLYRIPPETRVLVVVGEDDQTVQYEWQYNIWTGLSQIPYEYRDFVTVCTDRYGASDLVADHGFPNAGPGGVDALDYYGLWKLCEALTNCVFYGRDCEYALGGGVEMTYMGLWSDNQPVNPMIVTDNPPPPAE